MTMTTGVVTRAVVKDVGIAELKVGDMLLQDIIGYKDHILMFQGKRLTNRDIIWLRKKLQEKAPRLAGERYRTGIKAPGKIEDKNGAVLVKAGETITVEKLAPLLEQGFKMLPAADGSESSTFYQEFAWNGKPYRIDEFNPAVRVETLTLVDPEGKPVADAKIAEPEAEKSEIKKKKAK